MASPPLEPLPPNLDDLDIYCLKCGYNLRGLSGDPRRCPECFYMNPMGDVIIPAELISVQLRRMETAPATGVLCLAILLVASVPFFVLLPEFLRNKPPNGPEPCCCGLPMLVALVGWVTSVVKFRDSCKNRPGWPRVFLRYHLLGLAAMGVVFGFVLSAGLAVGKLIDAIDKSDKAAFLYSVCVLILIVGVLVALVVFLPRLRCFARGDMDQLQREVAVEIARETLRKNLAKGG
jgi:uncharacterized membrane protein